MFGSFQAKDLNFYNVVSVISRYIDLLHRKEDFGLQQQIYFLTNIAMSVKIKSCSRNDLNINMCENQIKI